MNGLVNREALAEGLGKTMVLVNKEVLAEGMGKIMM